MLAISELFMIFGMSVLTAVVAMVLLMQPSFAKESADGSQSNDLSLLFDNGVLHHASTGALKRFSLFPGTHVWDDLRDALLPSFPDFPDTVGTDASGSMTMFAQAADDDSVIEVNWRDGLCWVHLSQTDTQEDVTPFPQDHSAMRLSCETSPHPAWQSNAAGAVIWHNSAFALLKSRYPDCACTLHLDADEAHEPQRRVLENQNGDRDWFQIESHRTNTGWTYHATCISPLVQAEETQRLFVQTLAKTFAHLSIGLAIFDRDGRLGMFNPALVDLTGLQGAFLASQPTMMSFFDALRESRKMPEPKNYRSWRQDIAEVIAAASGGRYRETWTLEDGCTYAVQGRPHPDGATAFLIEDISAEITQSRCYRAEMEQFETVLDNIDDALVVFSSSGVLTFCNAAYRRMWEQNPEAAFADVTLADAITHWQSKAQTPDGWKTITNFAKTIGATQPTSLDIELQTGVDLRCTLYPLAAEATLVRFSRSAAQARLSDTVN
ncbi:PAS/PAC domain protein [Sulfitobacter noctilucae]|uniref:PAS-domain containing protein n=1 Tax=Sulfitobacter noctilucae TaxID=1342302 RepID=UPI00046A11D3|nr:PAS-domain containing protein [Sulfitobacter noctilucae]KIN65768.1 PAS/PAC domain protein [Sulfitobacter noctilucae]